MLNGKKQSKKAVIFSILVLVFICVVGVGVSAAVQGEADTLPPYTERERETVAYDPIEDIANDEVEQSDADDSVAYYTPASSDSAEASQDMGHNESNEQPDPLDFLEGTAPEFSSFLWPTDGGWIVTGVNGYPGHTGLDIKVDRDTPVYASAPGIVVKLVESNVGYGKYIVLDHGGGYQTLYAHNNSLADLSAGEMVEAGQIIAYAGITGAATGVHVHFEIRKDGNILDPENFVNVDNTPIDLATADNTPAILQVQE